MNRLNTLLLVALVALIGFTLGQQTHPAVLAAGEQQWEYAQVYEYFKDGNYKFIATVSDLDEKQELDAGLGQFGAATGSASLDPGSATPIPFPDVLAPAKMLDYMGGFGWELISQMSTSAYEQSVVLFTFKRPL